MEEIAIDKDLSHDEIIWRYLSDQKFHDLLETSEIYLSALINQKDTQEGREKSSEIEHKHKNWMKFYKWAGLNVPSEEAQRAHTRKVEEYWSAGLREKGFCLCWHKANIENLEMWREYVGVGKSGVAIRSTVGRLRDAISLESQNNVCGALIREVTYGDFSIDRSDGLILRAFFKDRDKYEFEREIRLLYWEDFLKPPSNQNSFRRLAVDLNILILDVMVSPFSDPNYFEEVQKLINKPISRSAYSKHSTPSAQGS